MENKENKKKVSAKKGSKGGKSVGTKKTGTKNSSKIVKKNSSVKSNANGNTKSKQAVKELDVKKIEIENMDPSVSSELFKNDVKKVKNDVDKKSDSKDNSAYDKNFTNKLDFAICAIVGIVFVPIFIGALMSIVFIPAALIMLALELFCICYHYVDNPKKKTLVYMLFTIGVILVIGAIVYTVIKTR